MVAEASDGREAVEQASWSGPDLALVDIRMPVRDGLTAAKELLALPRPPKVVVLTSFDADDYVQQALHHGASGFLLKDTAPRELLGALRAVHRGHCALSPAVTSRVVAGYRAATRVPALPPGVREAIDGLSTRERDVLALVAQGAPNAEISQSLFLGESTVKAYVSRVLAKLGVANRVQAALLARSAGVPEER